jgi:hypothetical protein
MLVLLTSLDFISVKECKTAGETSPNGKSTDDTNKVQPTVSVTLGRGTAISEEITLH